MNSPFLKAQHYYDQAKKMRDLAAAEEDEDSRKALLEIATGYTSLSEKFLQIGQEATKRQL
jgi:hypothetical protein